MDESLLPRVLTPDQPDITHIELDLNDAALSDPASDPRIKFESVQILNLMRCNISTFDAVEALLKKCPRLRAVWLNHNPITSEESNQLKIKQFIEQFFPHIELFNGKFTKNCGAFGILFVSTGCDMRTAMGLDSTQIRKLDFTNRDLYRVENLAQKMGAFGNVTKLVAKNTFFKIASEAQTFFEMLPRLSKLEDLEVDYYMLDMFWKIKKRMFGLCPRLKRINGYDLSFEIPTPDDEKIDRVVANLWGKMGWFSYLVPDNEVTVYQTGSASQGQNGGLDCIN